tara:strand:+ start:415 stop:663 length:249 start_codon:yes stop_codon:yes gene_type:complete
LYKVKKGYKKSYKNSLNKMVKNILIFIFIILGMVVILNFSDHNLKRAVDACLAGSQKLSKSKITDLEEARKFCEDQIKKKDK